MGNDKIYQMPFQKVYECLVNKAKRKGRTREEVDQIILWLTGYSQQELDDFFNLPLTYGEFFRQAPAPNDKRHLIKGKVCGIQVEEIKDPLMREIRYLDKLIDELAKGKSMASILRK